MMLRQLCCVLGSVVLVSSCAGQVVETGNLTEIDRTTFDGAVVSYFLPRAEFSAKASYDAATDVLTITHTGNAKIFPDVRHHYHAVYRHIETSSDEVTIEVEPNGLLKQISTTTTDQTQEIIKQIGAVAKEFGAFRAAIPAAAKTVAAPEETPKPKEEVPKCSNLSVEATYDLTYGPYGDNHRPWRSVKGVHCELSVVVDAKPMNRLDVVSYSAAVNQTEVVRQSCPAGAICFRAAGGYNITITAKVTKSTAVLKVPGQQDIDGRDALSVVAPRLGHVGALYFNRRAFVSNSTTATFTNGMLTKLTAKDPSAVVGALQLSTEILKSLTILVRL
jgi:hypothetical protein